MKRTIVLSILSAMLSVPHVGMCAPTITPYEDSVEGGTVVALKMEVTAKKVPTGYGVVTIGRQCQGCEPLLLKVTPSSQVVMAGRPMPITSNTALIGRTGDVFYVIKEKRLTRFQLY